MDNKDIDNARKDAIVGRAEAEKQNALDKAREQFSQFDMSKVKNKDALAEQDPGALDVPQVKKSNKFFFSDVDTITLPSGGYLYRNSTNDEDILKGLIKMKSMTVAEEKILTTQRYIKAGITTRVILDRCIESNIDAKDILVYDSNYLMFYLRQISYGDKYEFEITCGNLGCEKKFDHQVEISKLNFETLPEDIIEPIKIELPRSKYTVYMVLTRLHHLENISNRDRNRKKGSNEEDSRVIDAFVETTQKITDPQGNPISRGDWPEFFEAIPTMDRAAITEKITYSTGVDTLEGVNCPYCNTVYDGTIPVDANFFRL